jgi:hypothetical protein
MREKLQSFQYLDINFREYMTVLLTKSKKKLEYCLRLNVDDKNSNNMVAFTPGSWWSCGTFPHNLGNRSIICCCCTFL